MFLSLIFTATLFSVSFAQVDLSARDSCSHNNCLRAFIGVGTEALTLCQTYTPGNPIPSFASNCEGSVSKVVSACSCIYTAPASGSMISSVVTSKTRQAYSFIIPTYLEATSSIRTTTSTSISSSGKKVTKIRKS
jgi:polygalacturonase